MKIKIKLTILVITLLTSTGCSNNEMKNAMLISSIRSTNNNINSVALDKSTVTLRDLKNIFGE